MNSEEYLNEITEPIPLSKFLVTDDPQQVMEGLWYRIAREDVVIQYKQTFEDVTYHIYFRLDDYYMPVTGGFYANEVLVNEIPDEVANTSLKMLYPTISPITIGVVISAVIIAGLWVTKKLKF